ncbi:MAG: mechanosensitive ion channel [Gemmatimonadetes bacterium]|nr:mechanosensitive ion channel [Gemmatimonadota bacterium]
MRSARPWGGVVATFLVAGAVWPAGVVGQQDTPVPAAADPEQVPAERASLDRAIERELRGIFQRIDALADVSVSVDAGVVRLAGTVAEAGAEDRAIELATGWEGVLYVQSDIDWTASLRDRLEPTLARIQDLAFETLALLPLLIVALLLVAAFGLVGSTLGRWGGPAFLRVRNPLLRNIIARAVQAGVVLAGIVVALDLLDATALVGAVAGTAGLAGLAIGFAFKDIVENYLAGLLLAVRQPFEQNDHVVVEGYEGKVVRLTPRETILMTLEGNHVRLPNALVFRSPMVNYTRNPRRRFHFEIGVGPNDDLQVARDRGVEALEGMDGVLGDPAPQALVTALGDSWVTLRFTGWVDQRRHEFGRVRSEAIRLTKSALERAGVTLPSPEYLVRWTRDGDAPSGPAVSVAPVPMEGDVSLDDAVDRQIDEERRSGDEENLLGTAPADPES